MPLQSWSVLWRSHLTHLPKSLRTLPPFKKQAIAHARNPVSGLFLRKFCCTLLGETLVEQVATMSNTIPVYALKGKWQLNCLLPFYSANSYHLT
ncbi:hypothetical protein [Microseira sp. BLCC-F43]|uniref:hypothetical protein n=1 Tax=Microseira sp. BLCC-F43 TaxID=3153602 RepID=UPI0035B9241E